MRTKIFAGNWKMHMGPKEARAFLDEFTKIVSPSGSAQWVLFPPSITIPSLADALKGSFIKYGAQNVHWESKGAFTGEISPGMLKELGCTYALVGHSERRQLFGETDEMCAKKIKALSDAGVIPMYCVGETQKERDGGMTNDVLKRQLNEGLKTWDPSSPLVIAYEPVWAIGTGKVATPPMAEEAHVEIRRILKDFIARTGTGNAMRSAELQILYGGSVKPDNSRELIAFPNIDGFLVGGASLVAKSFAEIGRLPL
jgi:triosephosphate isomerase (TIM)